MKTILALYFAFISSLITAWGFNLVKLTDCDFDAPYKCEIIHGVGIVPVVALFTVWFEDDSNE